MKLSLLLTTFKRSMFFARVDDNPLYLLKYWPLLDPSGCVPEPHDASRSRESPANLPLNGLQFHMCFPAQQSISKSFYLISPPSGASVFETYRAKTTTRERVHIRIISPSLIVPTPQKSNMRYWWLISQPQICPSTRTFRSQHNK